MNAVKKSLSTILTILLVSTTFLVSSTASAQNYEVRIDEQGNYVLSKESFTLLWAEYNHLKRTVTDLESDKQLLIQKNQELQRNHDLLDKKIRKLERRPNMVVVLSITVASLGLGLMIGRLAP